MRRNALILFLVVTAWMVGDHPVSAQDPQGDPCPLKWRKDPAAAAGAREAKKQRMRENGVPDRYLHLLDKMECVACIETAPDTLHITVLYNDDEHAPTLSTGERDLKVEFKWSAQSERQLREQLRNGQIQSFYVWIHEKRCYCCPDFDQKAEDAQDWNDDTGLNMDEAQGYDDPDDLGPLPDDLKPPPPGSQTPPPPIERFDDLPRPSRRVLQATCRPCEELARQWTNESSNLNFLWDRKIEQMRRVSVIANARTNRSNEIERLEYEQRFGSTRTYDNLRKIKELKEVNEAQESDQDSAEREIERLDREIRETEMRMEELMQKFLECEKRCQTALTQAGQPQTPPVSAGDPPPMAGTTAAPPKPTAPGAVPAATGSTTGRGAGVTASDTVRPSAACPACEAAAAKVRRLQAQVDDLRELQENLAVLQRVSLEEQGRIREAQERVRARIAAGGGPEFEKGLADLEARFREANAGVAKSNAEGSRVNGELTEKLQELAAAQAEFDACTKACATATTPAATDQYRPPAPEPSSTSRDSDVDGPGPPGKAACPECQEHADRLNAARLEFVAMLDTLDNIARNMELLRRTRAVATDAARIRDIDGQLAQLELRARQVGAKDNALRSSIGAGRFALSQCNQKCTTAANDTNTRTATNTTGAGTGATGGAGTSTAAGATGQVAGTPGAACPDCEKIAAEADRIRADIEARNAELSRLRDAHAGNSSNLDNLQQLRLQAARGGDQARVQQYEQRISELQAANKGLRQQQFDAEQNIQDLNDALAALGREVDACNSRCGDKNRGLPTGTTGMLNPGGATRTVSVPPLRIDPTCKDCEALANELRKEHQELQRRAERTNATGQDFEEFEEQRAKVQQLQDRVDGCDEKCRTRPTTDTTNTTSSRGTPVPAGCFGAECARTWEACSLTNTCEPVDSGCAIPGSCGFAPRNDIYDYNLAQDSTVWNTTSNVEIEVRIQLKFSDVLDAANFPQYAQDFPSAPGVGAMNNFTPGPGVVIPPTETAQQGIREWFNPLGLLARRIAGQVERWRGSAGPRPLLRPNDLAALERHSGAQAGLPRGLHVLLTDRGGSTGKTLGMQIVNLTGRPVRLSSLPFAIEPIRQQAQQRVQQAFSRLTSAAPVRLDLAAYCIEFLKAPPGANQIFRLAPKAVQDKFAAMSKVLRSAYRIEKAGLLRPDSNPAAYTDSIKQWAVWAVEQRFNESRFTEAFLGHTRKNVEAAGSQWNKQAEEVVRKVSPNRWRDVVKVLAGAGLPVPQ